MSCQVDIEVSGYVNRPSRSDGHEGRLPFEGAEQEILERVGQVLSVAYQWASEPLFKTGCTINLELNITSSSRETGWVKLAPNKEKEYIIQISVEFIHVLIRNGLTFLSEFKTLKADKAIIVAVLLIFLHELAHIFWGHVNRNEPSNHEYRTDESSADYRSGLLLAGIIKRREDLRKLIGLINPDIQFLYAFAGALVLHAYIAKTAEKTLKYHGPSNRFSATSAGFLQGASYLNKNSTSKLEATLKNFEKSIIELGDRTLLNVLSVDKLDDEEMSKLSNKDYHIRVANLLNSSPAVELIRVELGSFVSKAKGKKLELIRELLKKRLWRRNGRK